MLRALLAGISGLRTHQTRLDVIGNNIANVNTIAFKASRVATQEGFAEILAGATGSAWNHGSTNPIQIGGGARIGSIDAQFTQGALEATGRPLDLAIQGDALFALSNGQKTVYSRAGNFQIDPTGRLVLGGTGAFLQGITADSQGNLTGGVGDIVLDLQTGAPPHATSRVVLSGNLDSGAEAGTEHTMSAQVFDGSGASHDLTLTFTSNGDGTWGWQAATDDAAVSPSTAGTATFNEDGTLATWTYAEGASALTITPTDGGSFTVDMLAGLGGDAGSLTSLGGSSTAAISSQDGYEAGDLVNITVDPTGVIQGIYSNGISLSLGQVSLATFNNPAGLLRSGGNLYEESASSGKPVAGFSGDTTTSAVVSGALEGSNVDITEEFTRMIVTQRGFQANARMISTADSMMSDMINIRR